MNGTVDRRLVAALLFSGAVLAIVGNALHPFLDPGSGAEEFLAAAGQNATWTLLHLLIVVAVVLLTAGMLLLVGGYTGTAGESTARLAAVLALIGATVFTIQIGGLDGVVLPSMAQQLEDGAWPATMLPLAETLVALDVALLSIVVTVYFGGTFLAIGATMRRTATFAPWVRWTSLVAGGAGVVVGPLMFLGLAEVVTFYALRIVALAVTVVAFGIVAGLRGAEVGAAATPPAAATA